MTKSKIRILYNFQGSNINIYINKCLILSNYSPGDFSKFFNIESGYNILTVTSTTDQAILLKSGLELKSHKYYTFIIGSQNGTQMNPSLYEQNMKCNFCRGANVTIINNVQNNINVKIGDTTIDNINWNVKKNTTICQLGLLSLTITQNPFLPITPVTQIPSTGAPTISPAISETTSTTSGTSTTGNPFITITPVVQQTNANCPVVNTSTKRRKNRKPTQTSQETQQQTQIQNNQTSLTVTRINLTGMNGVNIMNLNTAGNSLIPINASLTPLPLPVTPVNLYGPENIYLANGGIYTIITTMISGSFNIIFVQDELCTLLQDPFCINKYMGKWYIMNSSCKSNETVEYIQLQNNIRIVTTTENGTTIGTATIDCNNNAELTVVYPNMPIPLAPNYLIHTTDYKCYSLVGTPDLKSFNILSRNRKMSKKLYYELLDLAQRLGYFTCC